MFTEFFFQDMKWRRGSTIEMIRILVFLFFSFSFVTFPGTNSIVKSLTIEITKLISKMLNMLHITLRNSNLYISQKEKSKTESNKMKKKKTKTKWMDGREKKHFHIVGIERNSHRLCDPWCNNRVVWKTHKHSL